MKCSDLIHDINQIKIKFKKFQLFFEKAKQTHDFTDAKKIKRELDDLLKFFKAKTMIPVIIIVIRISKIIFRV